MDEVIIQPKRPLQGEWALLDRIRVYMGFPAERWVSEDGYVAITSVETPEDDHREHIGPEYHVSISKRMARVPIEEMPALIETFGMQGCDEDNHVQGIARHLWLAVSDKFNGFVCPCKDTEHAITEGDYVWRPQR